ncbi:MAG: uL23 family ribosomal protein [Candidatus Dormibacteraceae bacterium]
MSRSPAQVVLGPVISERSYALYQDGRYTFRVAPAASKPEIARALEEHYKDQGIKVVSVHTLNVRGKIRRGTRRGQVGKTSDWKKAVVKLGPGQRLEGLFGGV